MKPLTLQQIRQAVGGQALTRAPDGRAAGRGGLHRHAADASRSSLFVALKGEQFDGHDFLPDAAAGGAVAALVEQPPGTTAAQRAPDPGRRHARARWASSRRYVRKQMHGEGHRRRRQQRQDEHEVPDRRGPAPASSAASISPKSFNNDIGVPLTIFPADPTQDYLVLEMGTNHHGEIAGR